jgi:SAM-dependent methyltransferase
MTQYKNLIRNKNGLSWWVLLFWIAQVLIETSFCSCGLCLCYSSISVLSALSVTSVSALGLDQHPQQPTSKSTSKSTSTVPRQPIGRVAKLNRVKIDRQPDRKFYAQPNLNVHADESFRKNLSALYGDLIPDGSVVLDMMSSHVSHLPPDKKFSRVDVHGMNRDELQANEARIATDGKCFVRDLNANPNFLGMCDSGEYDAVLCCVGIQYLEEPERVLAEVGRILKADTGIAIVSFTNRFFYQKALTGWIERGMGERARLVKDFFRAAGGFDDDDINIEGDGTNVASQLLSLGGLGGDPYVAVVARRNGTV